MNEQTYKDMQYITHNYNTLVSTVSQQCIRYGCNAHDITIMAVSKNQPWEHIVHAYTIGIRFFGENRIQEMKLKFSSNNVQSMDMMHIHFIGQLQSNKIAHAVSYASCIQSIDSLTQAMRINAASEKIGQQMSICVQINPAQTSGQNGIVSYDDLAYIMENIASLAYIQVRGLMCIAPSLEYASEYTVRHCFATAYSWYEKIAQHYAPKNWDILSMGMSHDYEYAIAEGSSMIRIGSALFAQS